MSPLLGTPEDIYKKVLETGISVHRGLVGKHGGEWGSFIRNFGRQVKEGSGNGTSLSVWGLHKENLEGGGGSFTEDSKRHVSITGNAASLSLRRLREGNLEGGTLH
jgi:hypothetical protein